MEKVLSGKPVAQAVYHRITELLEGTDKPCMAIIRIGEDPASDYYAKNIVKQCIKHGFTIELLQLADSITEIELSDQIHKLNDSIGIHGIIIQKPLPKHIKEDNIACLINPNKDIDGINPENIGKIFLGIDSFCPCTALSVLEIIKFYNIDTIGRHVVILGRSPVVAKPLAGLLLRKHRFGNATVTVCHSYTKDLETITRTADILIAAIGVPNFVKPEHMKDNTICIDVGINQVVDSNNNIAYIGDIDYNLSYDKALAITPVPGGVGSVTTALLLENLTNAYLAQVGKKIY
jgi:methylenetetrahydrofolate dehydrogenase (NADP+)/methenyltetrahydrofolate cyclohydrolase